MCIYNSNFGFTNFDGATDGSLVATNAENACSDLCQLKIFQDPLCVSLVKNDLEEAHLNVGSQFIYELHILDFQMFFYLLTQPFVQSLNNVVLPLLWLGTCRNHTFSR